MLSAPIAATTNTFATLVKESSLPIIVDFWAPGCGPCRTMDPILTSLADAGTCRVITVNVDEEPMLAQSFRVFSLPTYVHLNSGAEVARANGAMPEAKLLRRLLLS